MLATEKLLIPENIQTLNTAGASYHFVMNTGEVVGEPTCSDNSINFFLKNDEGLESDLTLYTSIKARQGHQVSAVYVSKNDAELAHAVAWVNHTTGKADYMKDIARNVVGDKIAIFFLECSSATTNAAGGLSERTGGGFMFMLLLPIILPFFVFSLLCMIIGSIFGLKSEKSVTGTMRHAEKILESFDPAYAIYSSPETSTFKKVIKWLGILALGFIALSVLGAFIRSIA